MKKRWACWAWCEMQNVSLATPFCCRGFILQSISLGPDLLGSLAKQIGQGVYLLSNILRVLHQGAGMRPFDCRQLAIDVRVAHADQFGQVLDAEGVKREPIRVHL